MHKNAVVTFTFYLCIAYPLQGARGTIITDNDPLSVVEAYYKNIRSYRVKMDEENREAIKEGGSTVSTESSTLAKFRKAVTQLECGIIET